MERNKVGRVMHPSDDSVKLLHDCRTQVPIRIKYVLHLDVVQDTFLC